MKQLQLFMLLSMLISSCSILEKEATCGLNQTNLIIHFSYKDQSNNERFATTITNVQLFLFDSDNLLRYRFDVTPFELASYSQVSLSVTPAQYRVVCVANAQENTQIEINLRDPFLKGTISDKINAEGVVPNGDPLYYAPRDLQTPLMVEVLDHGTAEITALFRAGHVHITAYVTGFKDPITNPTNLSLVIELTNLAATYDFKLFHNEANMVTYKKSCSPIILPEFEIQKSEFNTSLFEFDHDVRINLRNPSDNKLIESLRLNDFLAEYYPNIDLLSPSTVNIEIEFTYINGQIAIAIPKWSEQSVQPDIQ